MKKHLLTIMSLLPLICSYSQKKDSVDHAFIQRLSLNSNHFSISVMPFLPQNVKITNSSNQYIYKPSVSMGLEIGINYRIYLGNRYAFITGLHGGFNNRYYRFAVAKDKFTPSLVNDFDEASRLHTKSSDYFLSTPALIEKQWQNKSNSQWNIFIGLNLRHHSLAGRANEYLYVENEDHEWPAILEKHIVKTMNNEFLLSFNAGGGYSIFLKNYNLLRFNISGNFSPTTLLKYEYKVPTTPQNPPGGTYTVNLRYIGISVEYIFTGALYRLKRIEE